MTLLLTRFTGQWALGSADKPTNSEGPGATRPSGTRSPHDSRAKSFREKVPTVPQAQSLLRPDRLILDRQVGQTLAGNAFSGSSPRHCHVWVPTASPRPQGLPRSKGRSSANKSTIKTKQNKTKGNPSRLVHRGSLPHVREGKATVLTDADGGRGSGARPPRHPRESSPRSCTTWAAHTSGAAA